jgi:hypothetical protein
MAEIASSAFGLLAMTMRAGATLRLRFAHLHLRKLRAPIGPLADERERREREQHGGDDEQPGRDRPLEDPLRTFRTTAKTAL